MDIIVNILQIIIALGIFNVWILRFSKESSWRGGNAKNMKEEFEVYGLPDWMVGIIGFLKVLFAIFLIVGIWIPWLVLPAVYGIAILMIGAMIMHLKVKDPLKKSLPSFTLLALALIIAFS